AGLSDLEAVAASSSPLSMEARLLIELANGYVLGRPNKALEDLNLFLNKYPGNRLALFFSARLSLKNGYNELALQRLTELGKSSTVIPLYYADFLRGEAYLHKGDYLNSISAYRWFIQHQSGQNYIKDAWYKIGLCYWLNGNQNDAREVFAEAQRQGREE